MTVAGTYKFEVSIGKSLRLLYPVAETLLAAWISAFPGPIRAEGASDCTGTACQARFSGTYRYAGDAAEDRRRLVAIDRATDGMFFLARAIARNRLGDDTRPYPEIGIRVADDQITIRTDVTWTTPADGTARALEDHDGDTYEVSTRFEGPALVQRIRDADLDNRTTFLLSDDGQHMRMHLRIEHARLSGAVDYTLTYRRAR